MKKTPVKVSHRKNQGSTWIVCSFLILLFSTSLVEAKTLKISIVAQGGLFEIGQHFLENAYQRIGMNVEFIQLPGERSLRESNAGIIDGEIFRVDNINRQYKYLQKIPTSFIIAENVVFTKSLNIHINSYEDLRPYRVGFRRGLKIAEASMQGFLGIMPLADTKNAFLMLDRGRVDCVIEERLTGWEYIKKLNLQGITVLDDPVNNIPLFHYLHIKNKELIPKLDAAFQDMIQEGVLDKIIQEYENKTL